MKNLNTVATIEKTVKLELGKTMVSSMLFSTMEKALQHFKYDSSNNNVKPIICGEIETGEHYLACGYDNKGRYFSASIYNQEIY